MRLILKRKMRKPKMTEEQLQEFIDAALPRKRCIKCDEVKPLSEFHRSSVASKDGHRNECISCRRKTEAARIREKRSQ